MIMNWMKSDGILMALFRPMNEEDFQRKRKEIDRRDGWPHTHKELFDAYSRKLCEYGCCDGGV